jgi:hypothetical protein
VDEPQNQDVHLVSLVQVPGSRRRISLPPPGGSHCSATRLSPAECAQTANARIALGIALVTLALGGGPPTPAWVRATSGLAGIAALLTWPFLVALQWSPNQWLPGPFYLVILWGLSIGAWLLITPSRAP